MAGPGAEGNDCPLRVLVNDLAPTTPGALALVRQLLAQWHTHLTEGIGVMQAEGAVPPGVDTERSASAIISAVQGGVAMTAVTGSSRHLAAALDVAIGHLGAGYDRAMVARSLSTT
ncbi:TetR family transcriptional regulator C-terminal domain-containing protein [Streptomyces sp. MS19]|uniref:TetR family transcriptional regulator C-terminal domain-containing protein n=1 Tax=Streptomyces sp. MS19 TaxID=3385972 RepID=UPI0039A2C96C